MLEAMVAAGAVDGVTGRNELSVDGLGISEHMKVVEKLREVFNKYVNGKR
ncbi:MAG: hypothetical protein XD83_1332 [Synergistales bacterium 57_84]|nr:MAG: hypothetical protein XD83_1332 [Synergistales bacterium 57_84]